MNRHILISGASIAGQTLAYWLTRHGLRATVVERAPGLRPGGHGVDLRDHALVVAERMGLLPQIRAAAADVATMRFVDAADRTKARVDMAALRSQQGTGESEIMRGDLVRLLHDANQDHIEYLFGDSIRELRDDRDAVTVSFDNGPARRFDLVIGSDGLHSNVRRLAFGPETRFLRHKGHHFAFADADASLAEDRAVTLFNTPGKMAGVYRSGNHAQAKAYFMFHTPAPIAYDHRDLDRQRRLLTEQFGTERGWHVPQLLAGAIADPDLYFDALSQVRMPSWSTGRVALVGDAAYCASPASGAGAELAIVGAYRLAGEIAATPTDHQAGFRRYEQGHRPLVKRRQQIGPYVRLMIPKTRVGMWTRNTITRLPLMQSLARLEAKMQPKSIGPLPRYSP
jgi:2-polyprenyl-6-methoxyphenol hydroxylase-like FAD-dependent oxidoreductase